MFPWNIDLAEKLPVHSGVQAPALELGADSPQARGMCPVTGKASGSCWHWAHRRKWAKAAMSGFCLIQGGLPNHKVSTQGVSSPTLEISNTETNTLAWAQRGPWCLRSALAGSGAPRQSSF